MQFKDDEAKHVWNEGLENNDHGRITEYCGAAYWFAETWANLMEAFIANGETVEGCAEKAKELACGVMGKHGLRGYQYMGAVQILRHVWEHGEALRRWHAMQCQIKYECEKANRDGGVLNPAVLVVGGEES